LAAKVAKTHGGGTPTKTVTVIPASTQRATDQLMADEKKGAIDKEIQVDPTDTDKKASYQCGARSQIGTRVRHFSPGKSGCFAL
jgi:hypothetical protein